MTRPLPSSEDLEIGPARIGDERAILECMRVCFGIDRDLEAWRHLFVDNPAGEPILVLARDRGTVVSHVALLPRRIVAFGREGLAGHSIDAMTLPAWQRHGLNRTLAREARRLARERGFLITYGVSNEQSTHGILKYQDRLSVRPLPVMVRPVRSVRAAIALSVNALHLLWTRSQSRSSAPHDEAAPLSGWSAPRFDERYSELFRAAESLPAIALVRDAAQLAWRYPPGSPYLQRHVVAGDRLDACTVVRIASPFGFPLAFIMEWFWRSGQRDEGLRLLRETVRLARSAGAVGVAALAMPGTLSRRLLRRHGFLAVPDVLFPETALLSARPEEESGATARWLDPSHWYFTWGDGTVL